MFIGPIPGSGPGQRVGQEGYWQDPEKLCPLLTGGVLCECFDQQLCNSMKERLCLCKSKRGANGHFGVHLLSLNEWFFAILKRPDGIV
jgi:hypothetical protein